MDDLNPYAAPRNEDWTNAVSAAQAARRINKPLFVVCVILAAEIFTVVDHAVIGTRLGGPPILFGSAGLAVWFAYTQRDVCVAALTPFAAVSACSLLVGVLESWSYAEPALCLLFGTLASLPAFFVGIIRKADARRRGNVQVCG